MSDLKPIEDDSPGHHHMVYGGTVCLLCLADVVARADFVDVTIKDRSAEMSPEELQVVRIGLELLISTGLLDDLKPELGEVAH